MSNHRRIAKNTMYLYFRMILIMGISFYTTRIVLNALGIDDYGIYNVVGGFVSMFAVVTAALTGAISRFLTFEIGKNNSIEIERTFAASLTILLLLAFIFVLVMEPLGIWFLNHKMEIAPERIGAAHWVLQCSILTFAINLVSIPYNALIVAHERMQAFAYISLAEAALKLGTAFLISYVVIDSLKLYAVLTAIVALIVRCIYGRYASIHFEESHARLSIDRAKFRQIMSFTGWTCIGGSASILNGQGVNVLLNLFWGTVINASRGIAMQVNAAISSFSTNFMMAANPQIIKSYAIGDYRETEQLVFSSARMSFFLMLLISTPIFVEMDGLLALWLKQVPEKTTIFTRIVILQSLIEVMCLPLQTLNQASGKVKVYQIVAGGILLLNFPTAYAVLKLGYPPQSVFYVALCISFAGLLARIILLKIQVNLNALKFFTAVFLRGLLTGALAIIPPIFLSSSCGTGIGKLLMVSAISFLWAFTVIMVSGVTSSERKLVIDKVKTVLAR